MGPECSGNLVSVLPEITTFDINPVDDLFLIVACDGVWDVVADEEACGLALTSAKDNPELAAKIIVRKSFEVGSDDNLTAVVVKWRNIDDDDVDGEPVVVNKKEKDEREPRLKRQKSSRHS